MTIVSFALLIHVLTWTRDDRTSWGWAPRVASLSAQLTAVGIIVAEAISWMGAHSARNGTMVSSVTFLRFVALLAGVTSASIYSVILVMRIVFTGIELFNGYPMITRSLYGFDKTGFRSLALLAITIACASIGSRDGRFASGLLWSVAGAVVWGSLLIPPFYSDPFGGFERSSMTLVLLAGLSLTLAVAITIEGYQAARLEGTGVAKQTLLSRPSFRLGCSIIAVIALVLTSYHLAVPQRMPIGGYGTAMMVTSGSAALSFFSLYRMTRRLASRALVEMAVAMGSMALAALATLFVPRTDGPLASLYPRIFNAEVVGFAVSALLWTQIASRLTVNFAKDMPETTMTPHFLARRGTFFCCAAAWLIAFLMAVWPRLPGIAAADDSLGRFCAGVSANLILLLAALRGSRRLGGGPLHGMVFLALLSTVAFVVIRMLSFTSAFG